MNQTKESILIIDDSPMICKVVEQAFIHDSMQVVCTLNVEEALSVIKEQLFDLILLDVVLPEIDGYELCKILKKLERTKDVPILFLTSKTDISSIERGFACGASDYISKPFSIEELKARVKAHLSHKRNADLLRQMNQFLQEAIKENQRIAITDQLTKCYNRSYFNKQLQSQVKLSKMQNTPLSLLFCDVDNFKSVNDSYGHSMGDHVLVKMAEVMDKTVPKEAKVARWGGEEFAILLPNTQLDEAARIAEEIRQKIHMQSFIRQAPHVRLSITVALIEYDLNHTIDENMSLVDQALYQGKASGKNRCVITHFAT